MQRAGDSRRDLVSTSCRTGSPAKDPQRAAHGQDKPHHGLTVDTNFIFQEAKVKMVLLG